MCCLTLPQEYRGKVSNFQATNCDSVTMGNNLLLQRNFVSLSLQLRESSNCELLLCVSLHPRNDCTRTISAMSSDWQGPCHDGCIIVVTSSSLLFREQLALLHTGLFFNLANHFLLSSYSIMPFPDCFNLYGCSL